MLSHAGVIYTEFFIVLLLQGSFFLMGIVCSHFFYNFFLIVPQEHIGRRREVSGALLRTAAMTETRVARDGDRQHIKRGPG